MMGTAAPERPWVRRRITSCATCGSRHPRGDNAVGSPWRNSRPTAHGRPHCTTGQTGGGRPPTAREAEDPRPRRTSRKGQTTANGTGPPPRNGCTRGPSGDPPLRNGAREPSGSSRRLCGSLGGLGREGRACGYFAAWRWPRTGQSPGKPWQCKSRRISAAAPPRGYDHPGESGGLSWPRTASPVRHGHPSGANRIVESPSPEPGSRTGPAALGGLSAPAAGFPAAGTHSGDRLSTVVSPTWGAGAERRGRGRGPWVAEGPRVGRTSALEART